MINSYKTNTQNLNYASSSYSFQQSEQVSSSQDREPESDWHGHMAEDTSTKRTKVNDKDDDKDIECK